jgi:hypothetical protein
MKTNVKKLMGAAVLSAALLVPVVAVPAFPDVKETTTRCSVGYQVGAYSRSDGSTYQEHFYDDLDSSRTYTEVRRSYIHASDSTFRNAYVNLYSPRTINNWSTRCA